MGIINENLYKGAPCSFVTIKNLMMYSNQYDFPRVWDGYTDRYAQMFHTNAFFSTALSAGTYGGVVYTPGSIVTGQRKIWTSWVSEDQRITGAIACSPGTLTIATAGSFIVICAEAPTDSQCAYLRVAVSLNNGAYPYKYLDYSTAGIGTITITDLDDEELRARGTVDIYDYNEPKATRVIRWGEQRIWFVRQYCVDLTHVLITPGTNIVYVSSGSVYEGMHFGDIVFPPKMRRWYIDRVITPGAYSPGQLVLDEYYSKDYVSAGAKVLRGTNQIWFSDVSKDIYTLGDIKMEDVPELNSLYCDMEKNDYLVDVAFAKGGVKLIFGRTHYYKLYGQHPNFTMETLGARVGLCTEKSVMTTADNDVCFPDNTGMWLFDGANLIELSKNIRNCFTGVGSPPFQIDMSQIEYSHGLYYPTWNQLWWWFKQVGDTLTNTRCLVYDFTTQDWYKLTFPQKINCSYAVLYSGNYYIWVGCTDGYAYYLNSNLGYDDLQSGTRAISWYRKTKRLSKDAKISIKMLKLYSNNTSTFDMDVIQSSYDEYNSATANTLTASISSSNRLSRMTFPPNYGYEHQITIQSSAASGNVELHEMDIIVEKVTEDMFNA